MLVRHVLAPKVAEGPLAAVVVGLVDEVDSADTKLLASYELRPL